MLTLQQAQDQLQIAAGLNPGGWILHSRSVAQNAQQIALHAGMDAERAYIFGLLHDIGRRAGVTGILHLFDGYDYMMALGEDAIARICLTHSFPVPDVRHFSGKIDCTPAQLDFLKRYLHDHPFDDYDRLIQLCDAISLPQGACIVEKRLVDVALRHGVFEGMLDKWRAFLKLKKYFDRKCGCSIYSFLDNVLENSSADLV